MFEVRKMFGKLMDSLILLKKLFTESTNERTSDPLRCLRERGNEKHTLFHIQIC